MTPTNLTAALLDPILTDDPAGPRITWYDDTSGARIELSALTLANWAAKTAGRVCSVVLRRSSRDDGVSTAEVAAPSRNHTVSSVAQATSGATTGRKPSAS